MQIDYRPESDSNLGRRALVPGFALEARLPPSKRMPAVPGTTWHIFRLFPVIRLPHLRGRQRRVHLQDDGRIAP